MDTFTAIFSRRSVRQFLPKPVSRADLQKIVQAGIEAPSGCNMQLRQYVIVDEPAVMDQLRPLSKAIGAAPAAIVLLVEPKGTPYGEFWIQDISAAMQNMLLAATALGLGSCWVEGALRRCEDKLRAALHVPPQLRVWSLMPVGHFDEMPPRPVKSKPDDVTFFNSYGRKA